MEKEKLILSLIDRLLWWSNSESQEEPESVFIGKYVILRCRNAWVHFGRLEYAKNWVYRLSDSRRLYRWRIRDKNWISLTELALKWIDTNWSQVCDTISLIEITERDGAEVIPVNESVIDSFKSITTYIPNN